ncbi:hypothetical protein UA08_07338 [Talaromyces atroroseus]|uniref:Fungistatic metabolite n=1 Tax=Talaromyces atroroseus TaxID=1441469 RepID=A0A225A921_TALAT|nr:hypothetical protein UA08_07338 [Talaromyces atroroseus]OKL57192.1 hypothetical protein UA08_07338 [Talaromyces atroroseus]
MAAWLQFLMAAVSVLGPASGLPTWPSSVDELEDIMFLNSGYQARSFSADITPCSFSPDGPSRIASAEWLRTAFHDTAPGNVFTGVGGLDASLQYELGGDGGENIGTAFNFTLLSFTPFFSSRASLADIIALGVYASVRVCGGPIIPIRTGRIDATAAGPIGVPLPQNSQYTFIQQFARMGFNVSEMIALTACGHTIGGVHAGNFPEVLQSGTVENDYQHFDSTTLFDEKIASEFTGGNSSDPLAGPLAIKNTYDSDIAVFTADNNATIGLMADPTYFQSRCQVMLQRLIEVVPAGVVLTDAIVPYEVKPSNLQLTIQPGGTQLQFTGEIRVRTTDLNGTISNVQLVYADRNGASTCGSCVIGTQYAGTTNGFDDSFVFYSFSAILPANTSISTFIVQVTADGNTVTYDNNGNGYPIQDNILFQNPQSCIANSSDSNGNYKMTVTAAVRNTVTSGSPTLSVEIKTPRSCCVVPGLSTVNVTMAKTATIGAYVLYSGSYALTTNQITTSKFSVSIETSSDSFKSTALTGSCSALSGSDPVPYSYLGCYTDNVNSRTLPAATTSDNNMTLTECANFCSGYQYFGLEYTTQCFCGTGLSSSSTEAAKTDCNMPCGGDSTETCGGANILSVYTNNNYVTPGGATIPGYQYLGCYNDTAAARSLSSTYTYSSNMTVDACATFCNGATYFGVEYYSECYCGETLAADSAKQPVTDCSYPCSGDSSEFCGGSDRLDLYQLGSTIVTASSNPASSSSTPTTAVSSSTTVSTSATVTTDSPSSSATAPVSLSTTSSTAVSTSATTTSVTATATGLPSGWDYRGCYADNIGGVRSMLVQEDDNPTMTIESCISQCLLLGYTVAGMEYSDQCFCDDYVRNNASLASSDSQCAMTCAGNSSEICGGPNLLSVYSNATITVLPPPTVQTTNLPGSWVYKGCLQDNVNNTRTFPYQLTYANNNSATACLSRCQEYGFQAAGLEYGEQCFCGDTFDIGPDVEIVSDSQCNMICTGDTIHYCGAGNLLSYYIWENSTTLWTYASGNDAGLYQFLIGGVVVPLMTTVNINGKVTFLEKWGTGPPNTTGAYELDLFYENDFDNAWRAMHVKTDIFCSAGLVLPDKAGRQLTIGGWSGVSTQGIRLYWPDGSPGQPGVNDWQENQAELSLQDGRWYPSGMIMANGSILVVGGETGSNGPPVPTIEVLPTVGPTLYMDWLERTDPNNLYPFMGVMPSKTILAAYYNEARLLDETTLQTIRTLPNMPGAVNNDLGGRTYPLEGTMVFFPQYAPYTDPVRVLICGGSTPYGGDAIDNCVSIQPDVPGQNWTIERMPSKRVMTCISPLPDGTFLILNGAHQGVAGFGLATSPNLNAVLYDPTKPVNQRMTVMANTTIARLYHSEAILLPDGRVLVSGSDPEDDTHPEEYRVEVFIPPYLLSGAARPAYTITETDWAYGGTYTITVTAGNVANLKVSLIGLISSTHGNSFGHRTLFPAFTCQGNQCTITAPPDPWTSPPGWFQLFILDGPTPSNSSFVRIGGDPGELGNWPDLPDFTVPGV